MRRFSKLGAFVLALAMVLAVITGCGSASETPSAESKSTVTSDAAEQSTAAVTENPFAKQLDISISCWQSDPTFVDKADPVYKIIQDKFNITINPMVITYDDYTEKTKMWLAAGEMPDIHQTADNIGTQSFVNWCKDGLLKAMPEDLETKYPNLAEAFNSPDIQSTKIDGKFYMIPMYNVNSHKGGERMMIVRKDWMNALGLQKPTTYDELVTFLKAFKNADPAKLGAENVIPLSLWPGFTDVIDLAFNKAYSTNWTTEDGIYKPVFMTKNYFESLKAWRNLYKEGLLDRDIAINKTDDVLAKFVSNKLAVYTYQVSYKAGSFQDAFAKANPDKKIEDSLDYIYQLKNQDGKNYKFESSTSWWGELFLNAKMDDEKYERCLALLDYMMTEEWRTICRLGLEGVDYKKNGDQIEVLLPKQDDGQFISLPSKYPFMNGFNQIVSWGTGKTDIYDENVITLAGANPYIVKMARDAYTWADQNTTPSEAVFSINYLLSPKKMNFKVELSEEWMKFVLGEGTDEDLYNKYLGAMKKGGIDEVIAEVNEMMKAQGN